MQDIAAVVVVLYHCLLLFPALADYALWANHPAPHGVLYVLLLWAPLRILVSGPQAVLFFFALSGSVLA